MSGKRTIILAALVALLQIGALSWSIISRASVLRSGQEILLQVEPVDPRDMLRGDYVQLEYTARRVPRSIFQPPSPDYATAPETVWVRLEKAADGYWKPIAASLETPLTLAPGANQIDVKAGFLWDSGDDGDQGAIVVDYGINRYYVPEGEGKEIEKGIGVRPFAVLAAVSSEGVAQIKALMDGDKKLYEAPWYWSL